jgi:hypothetical protein
VSSRPIADTGGDFHRAGGQAEGIALDVHPKRLLLEIGRLRHDSRHVVDRSLTRPADHVQRYAATRRIHTCRIPAAIGDDLYGLIEVRLMDLSAVVIVAILRPRQCGIPRKCTTAQRRSPVEPDHNSMRILLLAKIVLAEDAGQCTGPPESDGIGYTIPVRVDRRIG